MSLVLRLSRLTHCLYSCRSSQIKTPTGKGGLRGVLTPMLKWLEFVNGIPPPAWAWDPALTQGELDNLVNTRRKVPFLKAIFQGRIRQAGLDEN